ncbi:MAG: hypothetical protein EU549_02675 [Promethearchaeota archaeon]|nr:MAG: hypothetical protein EU549_02675 [Candidatus Lokiarchaeota archaeon]
MRKMESNMYKKTFKKDTWFNFVGPCKIQITSGHISVLNKKIKDNEEFIIKKNKALTIHFLEKTSLIFTGREDCIVELNNIINNDRKELLKKIKDIIIERTKIKIMVIGEIDSGKSTLIIQMINSLLEFNNRLKIGLLDLDMGQGALTLPTTIGLGIINNPIINIRSIKPEEITFIGNISPSRHMLRCIFGLIELLDKTKDLDVTFIDTTGWVNDSAARAYKTTKIQIIKPDIIVNLNKRLKNKVKIYPLLNPFTNNHEIIPIEKSPNIFPRSREMRKTLRENAYARYFLNSKTKKYKYAELSLINTRLNLGKPLIPSFKNYIEEILGIKIIYSEISQETLLIIVKNSDNLSYNDLNKIRPQISSSEIRIYGIGEIKGLIVGLQNNYKLLGLGLINKLDFKNKIIEILTPVNQEISQINFGSKTLTKDLKEKNYLEF